MRDDVKFIPENRRWDADEKQWVADAIGLGEMDPLGYQLVDDAWLKAKARIYCATGKFSCP